MTHSVKALLFFLIIFITSCGTKRTPNSCIGVICTADFRMMTIKLVDSLGADYFPDKVETYKDDSILIQSQTAPANPGQNIYTIVDDGNLKDLGVNIENNVLFKVFKNGQVQKQQLFMVKADCCHIIPISKDSALIVN